MLFLTNLRNFLVNVLSFIVNLFRTNRWFLGGFIVFIAGVFVFTYYTLSFNKGQPSISSESVSFLTTTDGSKLTCNYANGKFTCPLTCPDGSTVTFTTTSPSSVTSASLASLQATYCKAPTATATLTLTPPPSSTPTSTIPPTDALLPILTGQISTCDYRSGLVNFYLATPNLVPSNAHLYIDGVEAVCSIPSNNSSIFSCTLPAGKTFPAQVTTTLGGVQLDEFTFDGAGCTQFAPPPPAGDGVLAPAASATPPQ